MMSPVAEPTHGEVTVPAAAAVRPAPRLAAVRVAVAVVSWNTRELLDACLRSLRPDADGGRAEVWVIDNASSDGSAELVREQHPWVRMVASDDNLGFGPAVNAVAARTDAEWIAPANADIEVGSGALEALLEAGRAHPETGILAPRLRLPDGSTQHAVHPFLSLRTALIVNLGLQRRRPALGRRLALEGFWDPDEERTVDWAHGAFLLVRRAAWDAVGGFDDEQWMYAEDLDLCWRAARAGWPTRYVPSAEVRHHVSAAAAKAWGDERRIRSQRSAYAWSLRRRGAAFTRALALINVAGAAVRWAALALRARVRPARHAARLVYLRGTVAMHRTGLERRDALQRHR